MTTSPSTLVIGATQGTGYEIVQRLLAAGHAVRVLARYPEKARQLFAGKPVEIITADITQPATLERRLFEVEHIIFTAGVTQRPANETLVKTTEYEGVVNVLQAAQQAGFTGRFLYMTTVGIDESSVLGLFLNLLKRNMLYWRKQAEAAIRASNLSYTIIRAGILNDKAGGERAIEISQRSYPLALDYAISRKDVATVFVQALDDAYTERTSFNVVWKTPAAPPAPLSFRQLQPDA